MERKVFWQLFNYLSHHIKHANRLVAKQVGVFSDLGGVVCHLNCKDVLPLNNLKFL